MLTQEISITYVMFIKPFAHSFHFCRMSNVRNKVEMPASGNREMSPKRAVQIMKSLNHSIKPRKIMTINAISVTGVKVACARRIVWSKWVI